jgi:hypothetical protein
MEQPQEKIDKKLKISEARAEITSIKKSMFQQASVMRGDNLRAYLDKLRYAENVIKAEQAMGDAPKKELKKEHKKTEHKEVKEDSSSEEEVKEKKVKEPKEPKEFKEVEKKVNKNIEEVKKHIKKEKGLKPKERDAEHEAEIKALAKIPKALHSVYKKHLKLHAGDHSKAKKELKKTMSEMK